MGFLVILRWIDKGKEPLSSCNDVAFGTTGILHNKLFSESTGGM